MEGIDLLVWEGSRPGWDLGAVAVLPRRFGDAAAALDDHLARTDAEWVLLWDPRLGDPDRDVVVELATSRADAWHSGLCLGTAGLPEEHDVIHPLWPLARDAGPEVEAVSFRASLAALLVRADALRTVGGLDRAFEGPTGAGIELGRRLIDRGAVIFHTPRLVGDRRLPAPALTPHDRMVFLRRTFGRKWVRYAAARRVLAGGGLLATARALRSSGRATAAIAGPGSPTQVIERPPVAAIDGASVSVVLPTLGRYELLRPLLESLRTQTVRAEQVVVVDQNEPAQRDHALYEEFADLGLEVVFQDGKGQWLARNAAVSRTTGEWVAFLDDDSRIEDDWIEAHLEGLARYEADLTTGASRAVVGAPVPASYAFFRVADQWDSGNGLCRRALFEEVGLFDQQFDRQRRGDAEFGLRVQLRGGLVIHVPDAVRTHLKAAEGGLRTFGSWDGFRHRDRSAPLPLPSMLYYSRRYHTPRQVREDLIIGISQAIVPYHLKRRAAPAQWAGFVAVELLHVPSTIRRIRRSSRIADQMVASGPRIPPL